MPACGSDLRNNLFVEHLLSKKGSIMQGDRKTLDFSKRTLFSFFMYLVLLDYCMLELFNHGLLEPSTPAVSR